MAQQKVLYLQEKHGGYSVATRDIPQPDAGELLVKIYATGLNPVDWKIQKYGLPFVTTFPAVLGTDAAGVVEAVGEGVVGFKKGDRVFYQGLYKNDYATFQQYGVVPAEIAGKIPEKISFEQASTLPVAIASAAVGLYNPHEGGGVGLTPPWAPGGRGKYAGKPIIIFGGASAVGQSAIQLAKLSGFFPIITTASAHNAELLKSQGATHVVDRKADVAVEVRNVTSAPIDVVFDAIGHADTAAVGWELLAENGQLVATLEVKVNMEKYPSKGVRTLLGTSHIHRALGRELYAALPALLEEGSVIPNRVEVLPDGLNGIVAGLERLQANSVSGTKLVAHPQESV